MTRTRIGGSLDMAALALLSRPEIQHKPDDVHAMAIAARDLASRGLTARDIATALGLSEAAALQLLNLTTEE